MVKLGCRGTDSMTWARRAGAAGVAAGFLISATPAASAVMLATFTGAVQSGTDTTDFFGLGGDFDDATFTAYFRYDTSLGNATTGPLTDQRTGGPAFGGVSPILAATLRINGVTDVFDTFGNGSANVTINIDSWRQTFLYTDTAYTLGNVSEWNFLQLFVLDVPAPLLLTTPYTGFNHTFAAGPSETNRAGHFRTVDGVRVIDYQLALVTDSVTLAPIPEPATWAMLIGGFFGAGLLIRRRRALA